MFTTNVVTVFCNENMLVCDGLGVFPISMCEVLGRRVYLDQAFKVNLSLEYVKLTSKHVINVDLMTAFKQITDDRMSCYSGLSEHQDL